MSPGVTTSARNRLIVETPVVISDGSGSDIAVTPRLSQGRETVKATVAAAPRDSGPVGDKLGPALDPKKTECEPSTGPAMAEDAASAWAVFVAEAIKSVEDAGRKVPTNIAPDAAKPAQDTEPEDAVGAPDTRRAPMVGPLSVDWPVFPRSTGSFSFSDMAALGRRETSLVKEYTETDAVWSEGVRSRFLRNHWVVYQVPAALPCDLTMVFDVLDELYLEGMLQFLAGKRELPKSVDSRFWAFDFPVPSQAGKRTE